MNVLPGGNALLALAAAVLWGGGDFSGGMGVKRAGGTIGAALRVVLLSHAASFSVLLAVALAAWRCASARGAAGMGTRGGSGWWAVADLLLHCAVARGDGRVGGAERAAGGGDSGGGFRWHGGLAGMAAGGSGFVVAGVAIWMIAAGPDESEIAG